MDTLMEGERAVIVEGIVRDRLPDLERFADTIARRAVPD
jgi:hypothetical protein